MLYPRAASDPITVGPYTLTQLIGQGGMAVVYKAKRQGPAGFEKTVVVKAMLPGLIARTELVDLFRAEARLSAQLSHPNVVQVNDFGVADGVPYLVMEFLDGRNLTQVRNALGPKEGRLPVGAALAIARDLAHALAYAHDFVDGEGKRRQIIHRDVSPSNLMVCRDGVVRLLDFGVAKVSGQFDCDVTQSFRGKFAYMAPEQVNRQPIDRRVDVFAAGIVLHEMLTGKRLFAAPSELETLERVSQARVVAPSVDNPEVPRSLDALVKKALSRDPRERFGSGAELGEALEALDYPAWNRKQMQQWLLSLFPDAWAVECEVCGKQVLPGKPCDECGTEAPLSGGATRAELPPMPEVSSEPLPLPPPPHERRAQLRVVRTEEESEFAPSMGESMAAFPPPEPGSFEPHVVDHTPVDAPAELPEPKHTRTSGKTLTAPSGRARMASIEPSLEIEPEPSSPSLPRPQPKLFVVPQTRRRDDDSVKMGLGVAPRPAAEARMPVLPPLPPAPEASTGPAPSLDIWTGPAPILKKQGLHPASVLGGLTAIALLVLGGSVLSQRAPQPAPSAQPLAHATAAPRQQANAQPQTQPKPQVQPKPQPQPAVQNLDSRIQKPNSEKQNGGSEIKKAHSVPAAEPVRRPPHHRHHAAAASPSPAAEAPRSSVKEGRLVDPFAGAD